jgi:rare lipoprotein A
MGSVTEASVEVQSVINKTYQGYATWYSSGLRTASGEKFNPDGLSAAHRKLPFGTVLRLTNLENGNSIKVVVNDRGPFVKGKEIDVSRGAAKALGFQAKGTTKLGIEILQQPQ